MTRKLEGNVYPVVSENTIHGQWLIRLIESGEQKEQIDVRIAESLRYTGFNPMKESKIEHRKKVCYPIGSVAIIETGNAVYFLVAIAEFDDFNNARSSADDIDSAITSLLNVYDRLGMGYDLYIPLMGTGLSRAGLSSQEAYDLLTKSLMKNRSKIRGHIHLILRFEDRCDIKL